MEEIKTNRGERTPAGQFRIPKDFLEFNIKNTFLMFSSFLVTASSLSSLVGDGGHLNSAISCQQTKNQVNTAPWCHCHVFWTPVFVCFFSGLFRRCLFRRVGYSGLFQQGVSDFFWLGRFGMMCQRGITVVTEWSKWSSPVGMFSLLQRTTEEEAFTRAG